MNKSKIEELNTLAKKYGYTFSESANTQIGCTNMYKDGQIVIGNGSYQRCINIIKERESINSK